VGKSQVLIVPYVDENEVSQEPTFNVLPIRKWAAELYKTVAKERTNNGSQ
jgi:hypothetical protein